MTWAEGCELHAEGASDKPRKGYDRKRTSEKLQKFPSDIMDLHRGGQSAKNEFYEPMVEWKGRHPQLVGR